MDKIKSLVHFAVKVFIALAVINLILGLLNRFSPGVGSLLAGLRDNPLASVPNITGQS